MKIIVGSICLVLSMIFWGIHFWMWKRRQKTLTLNKKEQTIGILLKQNIHLMIAIFLTFTTIATFISLV